MYSRLNKLGMCVSHKTVLRMIKKLGNELVLCWKRDLEERALISKQCSDDESDSSVSVSSGSEGSIDFNVDPECNETGCLRYVFTGDNIDKNVTPRDMRMDYQTKSLHYFHVYAVLNRIDITGLSEEAPTSRLLHNLQISAFLPSVADCKALRDN